MTIISCTKQNLSNIWSLIHEKAKQHWGWIEKKRCLEKKSLKWIDQYVYIAIKSVKSVK